MLYDGSKQLNTDSCMLSPENNRRMRNLNHCLQFSFSILVLCSACLCFTLEKDWFKNIPAKTKIPSYALLGVSIAFSFAYSAVDFIQYLKDYFVALSYKYWTTLKHSKTPYEESPIIVTNIQIYLLLSMSFVIGSLFGTIFGIVDVEDYYKNQLVLYTVLDWEIIICEPIGFLFGGFTGLMIEFLR